MARGAGRGNVIIDDGVTVSNFPATEISYMYAKTGDSSYQMPRMDVQTHAFNFITYEHHEIHGGSSYTGGYAADIGNGANMDVLVVTPNTTKWAHLTYEIEVELETDINIYEDALVSAAGTGLTAFNRDRNSPNTAGLSLTHTPTVTSTGTNIRHLHLGSGKSTGGGDRAIHEWLLKQNSKYLFRLTNATTSDNYMSLKLDWYEHTNKTA